MLEAESPMPFVEAFQQDRLQLEGVIGGRVRNPHQLGEHEEHEQVVLIAPRTSDGATIGCEVELGQQRPQPFAESRSVRVSHYVAGDGDGELLLA